jgi:hypothetical protein
MTRAVVEDWCWQGEVERHRREPLAVEQRQGLELMK